MHLGGEEGKFAELYKCTWIHPRGNIGSRQQSAKVDKNKLKVVDDHVGKIKIGGGTGKSQV